MGLWGGHCFDNIQMQKCIGLVCAEIERKSKSHRKRNIVHIRVCIGIRVCRILYCNSNSNSSAIRPIVTLALAEEYEYQLGIRYYFSLYTYFIHFSYWTTHSVGKCRYTTRTQLLLPSRLLKKKIQVQNIFFPQIYW